MTLARFPCAVGAMRLDATFGEGMLTRFGELIRCRRDVNHAANGG